MGAGPGTAAAGAVRAPRICHCGEVAGEDVDEEPAFLESEGAEIGRRCGIDPYSAYIFTAVLSRTAPAVSALADSLQRALNTSPSALVENRALVRRWDAGNLGSLWKRGL